MARLIKKFKDCTSTEMPKNIDASSSQTTVFVYKNIKKSTRVNEMGEEEDVYVYDMEYYNKADWIAEMIEQSTMQTIDPVIDPSAELSDIIAKKATILGNRCTETIEAGFDCDGKHYSLSVFDQMDIDTQLSSIINLGMTEVAYHADGELCRIYSAEEFLKVACIAKAIILKNRTYVNHLIVMLKKMTNIDEIMAVEYGVTELYPGEVKKNYEDVILSQSLSFVETIKNKTGLDFTDLIDEVIKG